MLKNITFSVEEDVIQKARVQALKDRTHLNLLVREWLQKYTERNAGAINFQDLLVRCGSIRFDRTYTREELNER